MGNASQKFSQSALKTLIASHEKLMNWSFIYLGANLSNFDDADQLDIRQTAYASKEKMGEKFHAISEASIMYRMKGSKNFNHDILFKLMEDLDEKE